jgi:hypothetical protein
VKRDVAAALRLLILPTLALVFVAVAASGRLELTARIYALVVCAVALVVGLRALDRVDPHEQPLRRPARRPRADRRPPPALARLEQLCALGVASSFDLQYRLLPPLRSIAAGLLAARRGVDLEHEPEAARALLGEETWALVEPRRPAPEDRVSRGLTPSDLMQVAGSLERI